MSELPNPEKEKAEKLRELRQKLAVKRNYLTYCMIDASEEQINSVKKEIEELIEEIETLTNKPI